jgi:hypothetical protein
MKRGWVNSLHAAFLIESRTRGTGWRCVQEIWVSPGVFCREMWELRGPFHATLQTAGDIDQIQRPADPHVKPVAEVRSMRLVIPALCPGNIWPEMWGRE